MNRYCSKKLGDLAGITHGFGTAGVEVERYVDGALVPQTHQVHGNAVHILKKPGSGTQHHQDDVGARPQAFDYVYQGDAFLTSQPNIVCFVRTADCVPILIADPVRKVVGAVHAGWRGLAADVIGRAISTMRDAFGSQLKDIRTAIGPAICGECYEVGDEVITSLGALPFDILPWIVRRDGDNPHVDLRSIARRSLLYAGIAKDNIDVLDTCTSCGDAGLTSYRRDKTTVRQYSFILITRDIASSAT